jgi:hypothetical protein
MMIHRTWSAARRLTLAALTFPLLAVPSCSQLVQQSLIDGVFQGVIPILTDLTAQFLDLFFRTAAAI